MGIKVLSRGQSGRTMKLTNHLRPSSAKVTNEWSYTSTPPVRVRGVDRDDFAFPVSAGSLFAVTNAASIAAC